MEQDSDSIRKQLITYVNSQATIAPVGTSFLPCPMLNPALNTTIGVYFPLPPHPAQWHTLYVPTLWKQVCSFGASSRCPTSKVWCIFFFEKFRFWPGDIVQMVECWPSMYRVLFNTQLCIKLVYYHMPVVTVLGRWRWEEQKFMIILYHIGSLRLVLDIWEPVF